MMRTKRKPGKSIFVRLLVIGVSVYMVVTLSDLYGSLNESRAKLDALRQERDAMQVEIDDYRNILSQTSTHEFIEEAAHRIGYVYADEEVYIAY